MELKIKIGSVWVINDVEIKLQEYNVNKLQELIDELVNQNKLAKPLCKNIKRELIEQQGKGISWKTVKQLSKWCDTGAKGEAIAIEISKLLFKKRLPRLD